MLLRTCDIRSRYLTFSRTQVRKKVFKLAYSLTAFRTHVIRLHGLTLLRTQVIGLHSLTLFRTYDIRGHSLKSFCGLLG